MERLPQSESARKRYQIAFFALGWLVALGILFFAGSNKLLKRGYARFEDQLTGLGQKLSDAEATARPIGPKLRREEMATSFPLLHDRSWLTRPDQVLFGAYDGGFPGTFSGFEALEQSIDYRFPVVSIYQAWGDKPDQAHFPVRIAETIDRVGSVPMITWEPWVKDFDPVMRPNLPAIEKREYATLAAIARGDYDFYVARWAEECAKYGKPVFLRFAHEMNDPYRYPWGPQNGNRPDEFIAAWRHVHTVFQKKSATNVLWVWSPHISMPWFEFYYPGNDFVDWTSTGVLNYGDVAPWSRWWTFRQIFEKAYAPFVKFGKPIMITEFGTLASGGDATQWYREAFADIDQRFPAIKSVIFFNQQNDVTLSTAPLNWSVSQRPGATAVVREALARRAILPSPGSSSRQKPQP